MNTSIVNPGTPSREFEHQTDPSGAEPYRPAIRRPFQGRIATGVAAGLANYLSVDVTIMRIAFVVLTVASGAGIPLYLAGMLLIPEEGSDQSIASSLIESMQSRSRQTATGSW
jgi:phage shock protein PspC (stress-responsive transcriptional regulator)